MRRRPILAVVAALVAVIAWGAPSSEGGGGGFPTSTTSTELKKPTTTRPTTTTTAAPTTTTVPPRPPGLPVNEALIPGPTSFGVNVPRITTTTAQPQRTDGIGAFRTSCRLSHYSFDDPIVYPGQPRRAHLHIFYGNTATSSASTAQSIASSGASTCRGGTLNRSAYWAPAVIDTATSAPVLPGNDQVAQDYAMQVYYKTGYDGVRAADVQPFPVGLRMIAGTASSTGPQPGIVSYSCNLGAESSSFPNCAPGSLFIMAVEFPQCWDGVNLDSADHKSHMAYGLGWYFRGCPSSHPIPLPQITQHFRYRVPASGMGSWRLSSDTYTGPAGYSGHADWMNGWDQSVMTRFVNGCLRPGLDCGLDNLGDGWGLTK